MLIEHFLRTRARTQVTIYAPIDQARGPGGNLVGRQEVMVKRSDETVGQDLLDYQFVAVARARKT